MRGEIVRLENVLATRVAARANQDPSNTPLERSSKIEKYVEVMELTKCLRRQKEFLLSENRKRQRFAEKIQQAMPVRVFVCASRGGCPCAEGELTAHQFCGNACLFVCSRPPIAYSS